MRHLKLVVAVAVMVAAIAFAAAKAEARPYWSNCGTTTVAWNIQEHGVPCSWARTYTFYTYGGHGVAPPRGWHMRIVWVRGMGRRVVVWTGGRTVRWFQHTE